MPATDLPVDAVQSGRADDGHADAAILDAALWGRSERHRFRDSAAGLGWSALFHVVMAGGLAAFVSLSSAPDAPPSLEIEIPVEVLVEPAESASDHRDGAVAEAAESAAPSAPVADEAVSAAPPPHAETPEAIEGMQIPMELAERVEPQPGTAGTPEVASPPEPSPPEAAAQPEQTRDRPDTPPVPLALPPKRIARADAKVVDARQAPVSRPRARVHPEHKNAPLVPREQRLADRREARLRETAGAARQRPAPGTRGSTDTAGRTAARLTPKAEGRGRDARASAGTSSGAERGKAAPGALSQGDASAYRQQVIAHLTRFKRYPLGAEMRGAEGSPVVSFSLDDAGRAFAVSLGRSSGHADIDAETLAMVRRAVPFPAPPRGAPHAFSAAISFQLRQ